MFALLRPRSQFWLLSGDGLSTTAIHLFFIRTLPFPPRFTRVLFVPTSYLPNKSETVPKVYTSLYLCLRRERVGIAPVRVPHNPVSPRTSPLPPPSSSSVVCRRLGGGRGGPPSSLDVGDRRQPKQSRTETGLPTRGPNSPGPLVVVRREVQ